MSPVHTLFQSYERARATADRYKALHDVLYAAKERVNHLDIPWERAELRLTEDGAAIVRWTDLRLTVRPGSPPVWGWGRPDVPPYHQEETQADPPLDWCRFAGQLFRR